MRHRTLLLLLLLVVAALPLPACGSAGGIAEGARQGPAHVLLPFLSPAEVLILGIKNVTTRVAPAWITAYDPAGGMYGMGPVRVDVPARGEFRASLSSLVGATITGGGFVHVDTRDVMSPDAVTGLPTAIDTTGFVYPYIHRRVTGSSPEEDALPGVAVRSEGVGVVLTPYTDEVQLINLSRQENPGGATPEPQQYTIRTFDVEGNEVGTALTPVVAANGSFSFTPTTMAGRVSAEPAGGPFPAGRRVQYALSAREDGLQVHAESRFLEADIAHWPSLRDLAFEMSFGMDMAGNVHDFALLMSNPTAQAETVVLRGIYREGGAPILTAPRSFVVDGGATVIMKSTTQLSRGLEQGEVSWFDDIFGDVFLAQDREDFSLHVQAPSSLFVSARHYDPSFNAFYEVLRAVLRTTQACIYDFPLASSTLSGRRNYVAITNPTNNTLEVPIRAFTPERGTEYILPSIFVPPLSRLDWSPDGLVIREEPTDTVGSPVDFLRLEMVPSTGAMFRPRTEARDAGELLIFITPRIVRDD